VQTDNVQCDAFNRYVDKYDSSLCVLVFFAQLFLYFNHPRRHVLKNEWLILEQDSVDIAVVYLPKLRAKIYLEMMGDVEFPVLLFGVHQSLDLVHISHFHEVRYSSSLHFHTFHAINLK
jgi:hypothetical protein